jgi:hypothetical protein
MAGVDGVDKGSEIWSCRIHIMRGVEYIGSSIHVWDSQVDGFVFEEDRRHVALGDAVRWIAECADQWRIGGALTLQQYVQYRPSTLSRREP